MLSRAVFGHAVQHSRTCVSEVPISLVDFVSEHTTSRINTHRTPISEPSLKRKPQMENVCYQRISKVYAVCQNMR